MNNLQFINVGRCGAGTQVRAVHLTQTGQHYAKYCLTILLLLTAVLAVPATAEAAKKPGKRAVKRIYNEFLQKNVSGSDYFITLDINRDGVKELITSEPVRSSYSDDNFSIYTIRSGAVKLLGTVAESRSCTHHTSDKQKAVYYNKKYRAIRSSETGPYSIGLTLYRISGNKLKERMSSTAIYNRYRIFQISSGSSNPRSVSEKKLDSFEKKHMKKECKKMKLVRNTEKNRNRKL